MLKKAVILAAGMGTRLKPLTDQTHKCLTEVCGVPIIKNALKVLADYGIEETVIVTGYLKEQVKKSVGEQLDAMRIVYAENNHYQATNTTASLYEGLKRAGTADEWFVLEGDVFFEKAIFFELGESKEPDATVVEDYHPMLDGTFVDMDGNGFITGWIHKSKRKQDFQLEDKYKTVNIHKFSNIFVQSLLLPFLSESLMRYKGSEPLEYVMMRIVRRYPDKIKGLKTGQKKWAEIDDCNDLKYAEKIFSPILKKN